MHNGMKRLFVLLSVISGLLISSCGADYAATAGDYKISAGEIRFYLSGIKNQMSGTELVSEESWQTQEIEGMKAIDFAKERALDAAAENIAYVEIADFLGVELTEEEEDRADSIKKSVVTQYGGENGYRSFLKAQNIDDDFIEMLCESMLISEKLTELAVENKPITDEKKAAEAEALAAQNYKAKHILLATVDTDTQQPLPDEEKAEAKTRAEEIYARALSGEDFDALMNEFSEDPGLAANPDGYVFGSGEMVAEFENCVEALDMNAIGFAESDFGYHIIKRLPVDKSEMADKAEASLKSKRLTEAMNEWKAQAGFVVAKNDGVFDAIS